MIRRPGAVKKIYVGRTGKVAGRGQGCQRWHANSWHPSTGLATPGTGPEEMRIDRGMRGKTAKAGVREKLAILAALLSKGSFWHSRSSLFTANCLATLPCQPATPGDTPRAPPPTG